MPVNRNAIHCLASDFIPRNSFLRRTVVVACFVCLPALPARAGTVLFCPLDSLDGWSLRTVGAASAGVRAEDGDGPSAWLSAERGTVFLSRELPLDEVRGSRVTVRLLAKHDNIVAGPQAASCGKVHLAVRSPNGTAHHSLRFTGASDWRWEGLTANIPPDADRVLLNLGLEACSGHVGFKQLTITNDRAKVHQLDLADVMNADHEQLGLEAFPDGPIVFNEIPFDVIDAAQNAGVNCLRLRGVDHPDWPARTTSPIPVGSGATAVYILHAALDGEPRRDSPSVIWEARFAGNHTSSLSVFEGRQIGAVGQTEDLENWKVAWRKQLESGRWMTFGVTEWTIYHDTPIESLTCRAYRGASPVILAVTVAEKPPEPQPAAPEFDEMGNPLEAFE